MWGIVMFISGSSNCITLLVIFFKVIPYFLGKEMEKFTPKGKDTDLPWKTEKDDLWSLGV